MQAGLSLDQAPPISVPLRFFLVAPVFGGIALGLVAVSGPDALVFRWSPGALAATHLLTLGFGASVMFGALFQLLPVLAGAVIPRSSGISALILGLHVLGVAGLASGLYSGFGRISGGAALGLLPGCLLLAGTCLVALSRAKASHESVGGIRIALISLGVAASLGVALVAGQPGLGAVMRVPLLRPELTHLHLSWALGGWSGILLFSVALQVIPMFHLTPRYPVLLRRGFAWSAFAVLSAYGLFFALRLGFGLRTALLEQGLRALVVLQYLAFAGITLRLFARRTRRARDYSVRFWVLGLGSLGAAMLTWFLEGMEAPVGILLLLGSLVSVISGMLYKIVPFLVWFHLNARGTGTRAPLMKEILPDRWVSLHLLLHGATVACALLASALASPLLAGGTGILGLAAFGVLELNLVRAARRMKRH